MTLVVDGRDASDPAYHAMAANLKGSIALRTACDLAFKGHAQPNGYVELPLHAHRLVVKARP
jgi:malate synthase